jgi:hypothetical protein
MIKTCFDCGKVLKWVGSGPGWMNSDQWDETKAGDYFAPCAKASHKNGNCYFKDSPTLPVLKVKP